MAVELDRLHRGDGPSAGALRVLVGPRVRMVLNALSRDERRRLYFAFIGFGLFFWAGLFALMWWLVGKAYGYDPIGPLIVRKAMELLLSFLFVMLSFSNVITALSTYFLSEDLELVLALPVSRPTFHLARFIDTLAQSSWMMLLFGLPVFAAYGAVIDGGWRYLLALAVVLPTMLVLATNFGVAVATTLVNVFPARRTREMLVLVGVVLVSFLFVALRSLRPEQLADPESFKTVGAWLAALQVPQPLFFPPRWISEILLAALFRQPWPWMSTALFGSATLASFAVARWLVALGFDNGWARAQEARDAQFYRSTLFDRIVVVFPRAWRPIVSKELRIFTRDPSQWSQAFLLVGLCLVYLVSMNSLPIHNFSGKVLQGFKDAITLLNVGMGGFVMSAIAARFQFTGVGREGRAWWILRGAPVAPRTVLYAKAAFGLLPMLIVGEIVVVGSALLLDVPGWVAAAEGGVTALYAVALSGLAVSMGAWWPDFKAENAARAGQSPQAMFFMVVAQVLVFGTLVLFAVGIYGYFVAAPKARWVASLPIGLGVGTCLFVTFYPVRRAAEALWARGLE